MKDDNTTRIRNYRGQVTGVVKNGVYIRSLASSHILHTPPAIAISLDIIEQLKSLKVERVQFRHSETGTIYRATLQNFINDGFIIDRGAGVQWALPLAEFAIETKNPRPATLENVRNCAQDQPATSAMQLAFGGWR